MASTSAKDSQRVFDDFEKVPFKHAHAIAANSELAVNVGIGILKKGGSAADAAVAALLIDGISNPQSMGLGGGFLLTYYDKKSGMIDCLNAREFAPEHAHRDMYRDMGDIYDGGITCAVPGELKGYWELHKKYGKLPWQDLLSPAIYYCRNGVPVTRYFSGALNRMKKKIMKIPSLKAFLYNPETKEMFREGEYMKRPVLAQTLEIISDEGPDALYNGTLTNNFVKDIAAEGGIITRKDMETYRATWQKPVTTILPNNLAVYSVPSPGSGSVLLLILNVIWSFQDSQNPSKKWYRLVETWKHAFGYRCSLDGPTKTNVKQTRKQSLTRSCVETVRDKIEALSDTTSENLKYYSEDCFSPYFGGGTCHISILTASGDAVSVTSSINSAYGAMFASPSTGIVLNNQMMDFNFPQQNHFKCNEIQSNKQPLSSMSPTVILNQKTGDVRLIIGAAGGTKIISATTQVIIENILYNITLGNAISEKRLHHQLLPMSLYFEEGFPEINQLVKRGHKTKELAHHFHHDTFIPASSSVAAISVEFDNIQAFGDPRRNGAAAVISCE